MKSLLPFLLLTLSIYLLSGCTTTDSKSTKKTIPMGFYELVSMTSTDLSTLPKPVTIMVKDDRISGKGPINNWGGSIQDDTLSDFFATRMAGPGPLMQIEQTIISSLEGAEIEFEDNILEINSADDSVELLFRPTKP